MKRNGHKSGWRYRLEPLARRSFTLWAIYIDANGERIARGTPITGDDLDVICKSRRTRPG